MDALRQTLIQDHESLRALYEEVLDALRSRGCDAAKPALTLFVTQLRRHFRDEEERIFPAIEQAALDPSFPQTAGLRRSHQVFRKLLTEVQHDVEGDLREAAIGDLSELNASLRVHQAMEERLVEAVEKVLPRHGAVVSSSSIGLDSEDKPE